jgi:hypothetical protein
LTSMNIYIARNIRMLKRLWLQLKTSARLWWDVMVIVKAIKLQQVKLLLLIILCVMAKVFAQMTACRHW